jgi:hypothetical protein
VEVAALEDAPPSAVAPAPVAPAPSAQAPDSTAAPPQDTGSSQRVAAYVVGGAGIVGLALGGAFVLSAKSKYDDSLNHCVSGSPNVCDATGVSQRDSARTSGNVATVAFAVGAAAVAAGAVLWFTAPSSHASPRVGLVPTLGGALVRGEF